LARRACSDEGRSRPAPLICKLATRCRCAACPCAVPLPPTTQSCMSCLYYCVCACAAACCFVRIRCLCWLTWHRVAHVSEELQRAVGGALVHQAPRLEQHEPLKQGEDLALQRGAQGRERRGASCASAMEWVCNGWA